MVPLPVVNYTNRMTIISFNPFTPIANTHYPLLIFQPYSLKIISSVATITTFVNHFPPPHLSLHQSYMSISYLSHYAQKMNHSHHGPEYAHSPTINYRKLLVSGIFIKF